MCGNLLQYPKETITDFGRGIESNKFKMYKAGSSLEILAIVEVTILYLKSVGQVKPA